MVELSDELIFSKLGTDSTESKLANLEERFSSASRPIRSPANSSADRLKLGQFNNNSSSNSNSNKKFSRRSLDSATSR
jgi:hypothetical protein